MTELLVYPMNLPVTVLIKLPNVDVVMIAISVIKSVISVRMSVRISVMITVVKWLGRDGDHFNLLEIGVRFDSMFSDKIALIC